MAPDLPDGFVSRPAEYGALKAQLLDKRGDAVGLTASLRGAGGYGKTALANALCHDIDIQDAYFDGILRVELGERADNLLGLVSDLITIITGEHEGFNTIDAAASRLGNALGDRCFLLVIDDAWREEDLRPFLRGGQRTTRLITTRIDAILPVGTVRVSVDAMRGAEATALLARGLPEESAKAHRPALGALAARLGEWPFLLTLVNGFLRDRVLRTGEPFSRALDGVSRRLDARGLTAFDAKDEVARARAVSRTIGVSLELLHNAERLRFEELAVLPEDTDVPIGIVARLWAETGGLDEIDAEDSLLKLFGLSLVLSLDLERRVFRLHDVLRAWLLGKAGKEGVRKLHQTLAGVLDDDGGHDWIVPERDYRFRHLPMHLSAAGDRVAVERLLLDFDWISAKLEATGPQTLISDYRNLAEGRAQELVGRVLDLTSHILSRDPTNIAAQFLARLAPEDADGIGLLLERARERLPAARLVPRWPTFTAPGAEIRRFEGHDGAVTGLVVLDPGRFVSASHDGTLRLWDVATAFELRRFQGHEGEVHALALLDERHVVSAGADKTIRIWDVEAGNEVQRIDGHDGQVTCLCIVDGHILSGATDGTVRLWDAGSGAEVRRFVGHECGKERHWSGRSGVTCVASIGPLILSAADDRTLRVWDRKSGAEVRQLGKELDFKHPLFRIFPLDARRFLTGGGEYGVFHLWDVENGLVRTFDSIRFWALDFALLEGTRIALCAAGYSDIDTWDIVSGERLNRCGGHGTSVLCIAALDAEHVLSGAHGASIKLWSLRDEKRLQRFRGLEWWIAGFTVLGDGRVISASWNGVATLWDGATGKELRRFEKAHKGWSRWLALDDRRLVSWGIQNDQDIKLWDVETLTPIRCFEGHEKPITQVVVLDGQRIISASSDTTLRIWNLETGAELTQLTGHASEMYGVDVVDAATVVSACADGTLEVWDIERRTVRRSFKGHGDKVYSVAAVDAKRFASCSADKTIKLWDLETGQELNRFTGHESAIYSLAVLNGRHIASASEDNTLRVWNVETAEEIARIEGDCGFTIVQKIPGESALAARDQLARLHVFDLQGIG
jgi:WD40 repeat protein